MTFFGLLFLSIILTKPTNSDSFHEIFDFYDKFILNITYFIKSLPKNDLKKIDVHHKISLS